MKGTKPQLRQDSMAVGHIAAPRWLSKGAKTEWARVMPDLVARRILTNADLGGLENYCLAISRVREMETEIKRKPEPDLLLKLIRAQDKAMASARQLAAELGLTPVSRSRPAIREDGDQDDTANPLEMG